MMVVISLFSGTPGIQLGDWSFAGVDKLAHVLVFGLLGVAWARVLPALGFTAPKTSFYAVFLTTAFGFSDEMHQYLNPDRYFEWADLAADFAGALAAVSFYARVPFVKSLLEIKIVDLARLRISKMDTISPR